MDKEIISMDHRCKDLFTIIDMVDILGQSVGLPVGEVTRNVSINEYNAGAFVLAEMLPSQLKPQINHCAKKTIRFRDEIFKK